MRTTIVLAVSAMLGASAFISAQPPAPKPADELFRAIPQPANIKSYMQRLSARPHHVGSAYAQGQRGVDSGASSRNGDGTPRSSSFDVLFPDAEGTPCSSWSSRRGSRRSSKNRPSPVDPTSGQKTEQLPSYNAYSIDGDVTAPLVYVNYGRPEDYEQLDRLGISVPRRDCHRALRTDRGAASSRRSRPNTARSAA